MRWQLAGVGIQIVLQRHDFLANEPADLFDDHALLVGEFEVHDGGPGEVRAGSADQD